MEAEALSYESLRRIERAESRSSKLTKVEPDFWASLGRHLGELRARFAKEQERDPASREASFLADEIRSTQRLAEGIGEMRERKVAQHALLGLRTGKPAEKPVNATREEIDLYEALIRVLEGWRAKAMGREAAKAASPALAAAPAASKTAVAGAPPAPPAPETVPLVLVRALEDVPTFVAPDDELSYEFKRGEIGSLPRKAAELLAKRRKVALLPG